MAPQFVQALHAILCEPESASFCQWSLDGTEFAITDWEALQNEAFPRHFTCQWRTFLSYFSKFGFQKRGDNWLYHPLFTREGDRLGEIVLKVRLRTKGSKAPEEEVAEGSETESETSDSPQASSTTLQSLSPSLQASSASPAPLVVGYTFNEQYWGMQPGHLPMFRVNGHYLIPTASDIDRYAHDPSAVPCLAVDDQVYPIPGAVFHTVPPTPPPSIYFKVVGYMQGVHSETLAPGDFVVYCFRGQWCSVLTQTDVQLAQHSESRAYLVRQGQYISLAPGTRLWCKEEPMLKPTPIATPPQVRNYSLIAENCA